MMGFQPFRRSELSFSLNQRRRSLASASFSLLGHKILRDKKIYRQLLKKQMCVVCEREREIDKEGQKRKTSRVKKSYGSLEI